MLPQDVVVEEAVTVDEVADRRVEVRGERRVPRRNEAVLGHAQDLCHGHLAASASGLRQRVPELAAHARPELGLEASDTAAVLGVCVGLLRARELLRRRFGVQG